MSSKLQELLASSGSSSLNSVDFAASLDKRDGLSRFRERFHFPTKATVAKAKGQPGMDENCVYLAGNSLGLQPKQTEKYLLEEMQVWRESAVLGHFEHAFKRDWLKIDEHVLPMLADLVGAKVSEVACMGSLTANLHLLLTNMYRPTAQRHKILFEAKAFPSDSYAFASQVAAHGLSSDSLIPMEPLPGEYDIKTSQILEIIEEQGDSIAIICFGGVQYYSGQCFDMQAITKAGHEKGCLVAFDLAHAIGNVPLKLHDWGVDFACWCSYKYLNAGPGGIAGIYVHERWADKPRLSGWWGHDIATRFQMPFKFSPAPGTAGWQLSNPSVLDVISLYSSLEIFREAKDVSLSFYDNAKRPELTARREKSELMTAYLEALLQSDDRYVGITSLSSPRQVSFRFTIITPSEVERRGAQLSILFDPVEAMDVIFDDLRSQGVLGDERRPGVIRLAPVPLYNTFADCLAAYEAFKRAMDRYSAQPPK